MKLYDYFRSTACYRVRIALNMKQLSYEKIEIHLVNNHGEQNSPEYKRLNPQGLVPSLEIDDQIITQSLAIIEYLEEAYPEISLLPKQLLDKTKVRALAALVACDMHPLNNLRVLNRLKTQFAADEQQLNDWYHHWLKTGFDAFETQLKLLERSKPLCIGSQVSLADICLIPQVYNAQRFNFSLEHYPLIRSINEYCLTIEAFQKAAP